MKPKTGQRVTVTTLDGAERRVVEAADIGPCPPPGSPAVGLWVMRHIATTLLAVVEATDPELTVAKAAELCLRDPETVRLWCTSGLLGTFDRDARRWRIRRSDLVALLVKQHGAENLPAPLR